MKKTTILSITVLLVSYSFLAKAQDDASHENNYKNAINAHIGYFSGHINYERIIKEGMWKRNISSSIRVSAVYQRGLFLSSWEPTAYLGTHYGLLFGQDNNKLEVFTGLIFFRDLSFLPSGNIGYRYVGNGEIPLSYRVGLSFPEAAYMGFGFTF